MRTLVAVSVLSIAIVVGGCAGMSPTAQRTVTGGAMGAAGGAILGAIAGDAGMGAAIGGLVGAGGGFLYGKHKEAEENAYRRGHAEGARREQQQRR
jgi:hypothetical protein